MHLRRIFERYLYISSRIFVCGKCDTNIHKYVKRIFKRRLYIRGKILCEVSVILIFM